MKSEARGYAACLQNVGLFLRVDSQVWHPGLVCDAATEHRPQSHASLGYWMISNGRLSVYRGQCAFLGFSTIPVTGLPHPKNEGDSKISARHGRIDTNRPRPSPRSDRWVEPRTDWSHLDCAHCSYCSVCFRADRAFGHSRTDRFFRATHPADAGQRVL